MCTITSAQFLEGFFNTMWNFLSISESQPSPVCAPILLYSYAPVYVCCYMIKLMLLQAPVNFIKRD